MRWPALKPGVRSGNVQRLLAPTLCGPGLPCLRPPASARSRPRTLKPTQGSFREGLSSRGLQDRVLKQQCLQYALGAC